MSQPFGHIPGFHLPGTLVPIGAVVQQQYQQQADAEQRRRRIALLLLMSAS